MLSRYNKPWRIGQKCKGATGYTVEQFKKLHDEIKMNNSPQRTKSQAIALYLNRLHHGHSLEFIAYLFGQELTFQDVRNYCKEVEQAMMRSIVQKHLGVGAIERQILIRQHTTNIAEQLLDINADNEKLLSSMEHMFIIRKVLIIPSNVFHIACIKIVPSRNHSLDALQMDSSLTFGDHTQQTLLTVRFCRVLSMTINVYKIFWLQEIFSFWTEVFVTALAF